MAQDVLGDPGSPIWDTERVSPSPVLVRPLYIDMLHGVFQLDPDKY